MTLTIGTESWRYPEDPSLLTSLLQDETIRQMLQSGKARRERETTRARLLAGAVMVDPEVLPHLSSAARGLVQHFPQVQRVEFFVYNSAEMNAFVTTGRTSTLVAVSSGAVNSLDGPELAFVLGHELGHATFGHMNIAGSLLAEDSSLLPVSAMKVRAWQRAAEISADRAGLAVCGSVDVAARTLFKSASGIVSERIAASPEHFASQWQRLVGEITEDGQRDFWQVSHPFPPLRMRAMLLFWAAQQDPDAAALGRANQEIARMLAMMDPAGGSETLCDPLLVAFFFWGGLYIALGDGHLHDGELQRLESVAPPGITCDAAVADARASPSLCMERFAEVVRSRRQKLSAVELHRIIYGLVDVASADGHVSDAELARLRELGAALGVSARACDVIINQYEQEGGRGN